MGPRISSCGAGTLSFALHAIPQFVRLLLLRCASHGSFYLLGEAHEVIDRVCGSTDGPFTTMEQGSELDCFIEKFRDTYLDCTSLGLVNLHRLIDPPCSASPYMEEIEREEALIAELTAQDDMLANKRKGMVRCYVCCFRPV